MLMPFGKHKDQEVSEIPDGYLQWLYGEAEIRSDSLRRAVAAELDARGFEVDEADLEGDGAGEPAAPRITPLAAAFSDWRAWFASRYEAGTPERAAVDEVAADLARRLSDMGVR